MTHKQRSTEEDNVNKKTFLITTVLAALVMIVLLFVRIGLDGARATGFIHIVDAVAGWFFSCLGFVISLTVLVFRGDPPGNGIILMFLGIISSSLIWGVVVESSNIFSNRKRKNDDINCRPAAFTLSQAPAVALRAMADRPPAQSDANRSAKN